MELRNHAIGIIFFGVATMLGGTAIYAWDRWVK